MNSTMRADFNRFEEALERLGELMPPLPIELANAIQVQLNELDRVRERLVAAARQITWPAARDVKRREDMGAGYVRVLLDSDNDATVEVWNGERSAAVEFCNPGAKGGGRSRETRMALIALMVAIEADNAGKPLSDVISASSA